MTPDELHEKHSIAIGPVLDDDGIKWRVYLEREHAYFVLTQGVELGYYFQVLSVNRIPYFEPPHDFDTYQEAYDGLMSIVDEDIPVRNCRSTQTIIDEDPFCM